MNLAEQWTCYSTSSDLVLMSYVVTDLDSWCTLGNCGEKITKEAGGILLPFGSILTNYSSLSVSMCCSGVYRVTPSQCQGMQCNHSCFTDEKTNVWGWITCGTVWVLGELGFQGSDFQQWNTIIWKHFYFIDSFVLYRLLSTNFLHASFQGVCRKSLTLLRFVSYAKNKH